MPKPNIKKIVADIIQERKMGEFSGRDRYPQCPRRIPQKELEIENVPSKELAKMFIRDWYRPSTADPVMNTTTYR